MRDACFGLVAVAALLVAGAGLFRHYVVRVRRARDWLSRGAVLVDVDSAELFARVHPRAAVSIPFEDLARRAPELGAKEQPLVVYAHRWRRGAEAARSLRRTGFFRVMNAAGLHTLEKLAVGPRAIRAHSR